MDLGLTGARVLVTGATRGIGLGIAEALAREGAQVATCARHVDDPTPLRAAVDVTDAGALAAWVQDAAAALGGIDAVVANAGGAEGGDLRSSTPEDWRATYELNVGHFAVLLRAAEPHLRRSAQPAALVITSISGRKPQPRAQYGAAKAAAAYAAAALARELVPVRVNALAPGSITFPGGGWERHAAERPERHAAFLEHELPAGRLGTVGEVADVAAFLLSPRASWVNGTEVHVDGAQGRPSAAGW